MKIKTTKKEFKCNCGMCKTKLSIIKFNNQMYDIGIKTSDKKVYGVVLYEKDIKRLKEFL